MDLSGGLTKTAQQLIRRDVDDLCVWHHPPSGHTLGFHILVIQGKHKEKPISSTGVSKNATFAFVKALGEFGENLLCREQTLNNRAGIAGGLFQSSSKERAKCELLEHDAFFYHYRDGIPFKHIADFSASHAHLAYYRLESADPQFSTVLLCDRAYLTGASSCMLYGMGTNASIAMAQEKAFSEYAIMHMNHSLYPDSCKDIQSLASCSIELPDFHHAASKDPRNRQRMIDLCKVSLDWVTPKRSPLDLSKWQLKRYSSPIQFFQYCKALHPDLIPIEFGKPETDASVNCLPLFHPLW